MDLRAWGVPGSDLRAWGVIWERKLRGPRSTRPLTRSRIGAKLNRLADKSNDLRKWTKLDDKLMDLRALGVPGSDLRPWGVIWERKLIKLGDPPFDPAPDPVPDRRQIVQIS